MQNIDGSDDEIKMSDDEEDNNRSKPTRGKRGRGNRGGSTTRGTRGRGSRGGARGRGKKLQLDVSQKTLGDCKNLLKMFTLLCHFCSSSNSSY